MTFDVGNPTNALMVLSTTQAFVADEKGKLIRCGKPIFFRTIDGIDYGGHVKAVREYLKIEADNYKHPVVFITKRDL